MHEIYASWLGWNAAEKEAAMTEQFVVPHVLLCRIQTWHLYLSCQMSHSLSKSGILFRGFSCQFFTLTGTICCNLMPLSLTPSDGNLLVGAEVSACIHRHTVGTHTIISDFPANTAAILVQ